jgi:hypothetical protein
MTAKRDERMPVMGAAAVTVLVWASAFVGIRSAGRALSPGALALGRLVVGSGVLGAFVLARHEPLPRRRALAATVFCGLLWVRVPPLLALPDGALCLAGVALSRTRGRRGSQAAAAPARA